MVFPTPLSPCTISTRFVPVAFTTPRNARRIFTTVPRSSYICSSPPWFASSSIVAYTARYFVSWFSAL